MQSLAMRSVKAYLNLVDMHRAKLVVQKSRLQREMLVFKMKGISLSLAILMQSVGNNLHFVTDLFTFFASLAGLRGSKPQRCDCVFSSQQELGDSLPIRQSWPEHSSAVKQ